MTQLRTASLLTHLTLAASGLCLAAASMPLLPEMPFILVAYLLLVGLSWRWGGRRVMPNWAANVLALMIAGGAVGYVMLRVYSSLAFEWIHDLPVQVILIPLLCPVLMALAVVRLFRSRTPQDILQLHGMALLQVALGCVLASPTLFGLLLLAYFGLALCALAANEARSQQREAPPPGPLPAAAGSVRRSLGFGLRWLLLLVVPAFVLFLLLPRIDGREWTPLARLSQRRHHVTLARTGSSDEIDLRRTGTLVNDDAVAFVVKVLDGAGGPAERLPEDQHWRGPVLDRYEGGVWKAELSGFNGVPLLGTPPGHPEGNPEIALLEFRVQSQAGSLFLAEPVVPGALPGQLPVQMERHPQSLPLFFEAGGTALPMTYLTRSDYRYSQSFSPTRSRVRYPCVRVSDFYQFHLLRCNVLEMRGFTLDLLRRLGDGAALRKVVAEMHADLARPEHQRRDSPLPPGQWAGVCRLLTDHLAHAGEYAYDMTSRRADGSIDPTLDFLRNVRRGSCERYASALALMLRSVGIPARIVKGYRGWESPGTGTYQILQRQAHAWVEAMVAAETAGPLRMEWLILDPTPAHEDSSGLSLVGWLQQQQRNGQSLWQDMVLNYDPGRQSALWRELSAGAGLRKVAWLLLATALSLVVFLFRRRRARSPSALGPALLFARLRAVLVAGLPLTTHPTQTPAELAELACAGLADRPATLPLADLPARVVALYYRERFGRLPASPAEVAALSAEVDRLATALQAAGR